MFHFFFSKCQHQKNNLFKNKSFEKKIDPKIAKATDLKAVLAAYTTDDYEMLSFQMSESTARLQPHQFITTLFEKQNEPKFADLFENLDKNL